MEALRANLRDDLRQKEALRPLHLEKESTYRADGSATVSQGKTTVVTAVYGPKRIPTTNVEFSDKAVISVKISYTNEKDDATLMEMEYMIQKLLENVIQRSLFPRTTINVFIQVICDDGSLLAVIMNSVMLALDDSGIPINNKFASLCLLVGENGDILPDPTRSEEHTSELQSL